MAKLIMAFAALAGLTAVILGAFGAHGLKGKIDPQMLGAFQTGVQYQMYHALALLVIGFILRTHSEPMLIATAFCFALGILLFSGSLYGLAIGGPRWLGPVTPLGGVCFIAGWLVLLISIIKH